MIVVAHKHITDYAGTEDIAVASTGTVYTKSEPLKYNEYFGLFVKATSSGTVAVTITLEQSYKKPSSEGKADTDWVAPDGASTIIALSDENAHIIPISDMKTMPYFRLKMVGGAGNDASTTVE
ncbi:MAG: hypothetical protein WC343_03695, partial [Bacilli bacterium]